MSEDTWYRHRDEDGVALLGAPFRYRHYCDEPRTYEAHKFLEDYIRPAMTRLADDIAESLEWK